MLSRRGVSPRRLGVSLGSSGFACVKALSDNLHRLVIPRAKTKYESWGRPRVPVSVSNWELTSRGCAGVLSDRKHFVQACTRDSCAGLADCCRRKKNLNCRTDVQDVVPGASSNSVTRILQATPGPSDERFLLRFLCFGVGPAAEKKKRQKTNTLSAEKNPRPHERPT